LAGGPHAVVSKKAAIHALPVNVANKARLQRLGEASK
jgi:hypothetical protein